MKKIMICSGKGGVGKTTISVSLAKYLSEKGHVVGLVDADIDGPNIPEFTDTHQELGTGEKLKPVRRDNLEMISVGFILKENDFVSWPSEKRGMAVQQLIQAVDWNSEMEYMVIDTPPGTSDEIEYIAGVFSPEIIFIVSTPHEASISDVKRTISMLKNYNLDIAGIIMNMASITCKKCGDIIYEANLPDEINGVPIVSIIEYAFNGECVDTGKIFDIVMEAS